MRSYVRHCLIAFGLMVAVSAAPGQTAPPLPPGQTALPPGHPPVGPGPAPEAPSGDLPPGHPPIAAPGADAAGAANPHGSTTADSSQPDPDLPPGTIVAQIVNAAGQPIAGREVRLGVLRQSVAEGESRSFQSAVSSETGEVRFAGLQTETAFSYRVTLKEGEAEYASPPFNLRPEAGQRVLLHIYPVTTELRGTMVGMRGIVVVETRDDVFQLEMMLRIFNVGRTTWVPKDVSFALPEGTKGFVANETMTDVRVKLDGERNVQLLGTYTPGQHDVTFRFQVPNNHTERREISFDLPPRVAELRIIAAAAPGMSMSVPGFEAAEPSVGNNGERMLVTGRQLRPGDPELEAVTIQLSGIPTPGPGRWIAAALALLAALGGLAGYLRRSPVNGGSALPAQDAAAARSRLLDELVDVERAHRQGEIGPKTYERARRALVDALTRLEADKPSKSISSRSTAAA